MNEPAHRPGASGREHLRTAARVVVKIGSSSLTTAQGGIDDPRLEALVAVLAERRTAGREVVLVSSGAIAAGLAPLGLERRPRDLASQQAAASVGQGLLLARYTAAFAAAGLTVGQVLLTADDVVRRSHYGNAQRTLDRLLALGVVPVVNENDTVATHEIRFGDNDRLAALVAHLVRADALVLLSDVDALYDAPPQRPGARRIPQVLGPDDLDGVRIGSTGSGVGTGGMTTKVQAAHIAVSAGVPTLVTSAALAAEALAGSDVGTWFPVPPGSRGRRRSSRMLWLAHAAAPAGRLQLDEGAVRAVLDRRSSLLPAGLTAVHGDFRAGDPVDLVDGNGHALARGLVNYSSEELPAMLGRTTRDLAGEWGPGYEREVVHRDHLVLLPGGGAAPR
ncbi:glutamate 5-kinase [Kineococcus xinjiangensis]|uniref:Glutamate 5-kinase n=1 Tax=Kineococcus xinjiangensis TaxID=512762 RepID=A0A2S6IIV9_9ACTN|nr:glutamate 5-kinase [Kineococcus xinjiangensis]PPK94164.1 glutamate 5-kinase [Kineococcus xinjiangensis]